MAQILIGTSGWTYRSWRSRFYPRSVSPRSCLSFYAHSFPTTEINCSFYQLPSGDLFKKWAALAPDHFIFAVKANRMISHVQQLASADEPWATFLANAARLQSHLGPILLQLPPTFHRRTPILERFLERAVEPMAKGLRLAIEFRHESWQTTEIYRLLARYHVAACIADGVKYPRKDVITANFAYLRYHGRTAAAPDYSDSELRQEASMIRRLARDGIDVYAYFNNDAEAKAVKNANTLKLFVS